jgi:hypothetical protein
MREIGSPDNARRLPPLMQGILTAWKCSIMRLKKLLKHPIMPDSRNLYHRMGRPGANIPPNAFAIASH